MDRHTNAASTDLTTAPGWSAETTHPAASAQAPSADALRSAPPRPYDLIDSDRTVDGWDATVELPDGRVVRCDVTIDLEWWDDSCERGEFCELVGVTARVSRPRLCGEESDDGSIGPDEPMELTEAERVQLESWLEQNWEALR